MVKTYRHVTYCMASYNSVDNIILIFVQKCNQLNSSVGLQLMSPFNIDESIYVF